jgi:hypothetical protein
MPLSPRALMGQGGLETVTGMFLRLLTPGLPATSDSDQASRAG